MVSQIVKKEGENQYSVLLYGTDSCLTRIYPSEQDLKDIKIVRTMCHYLSNANAVA
jgi:hypothetical protein